jgi:hypothetical protein
MDPRDDDIEFDFFEDEPATRETSSQPRVRLPGRPGNGGSTPRKPLMPARTGAPLLRLLTLVLFVIFLVVVFAWLLQSCAAESKQDAYAAYMDDVRRIATQSNTNGKAVVDVLVASGLTVPEIQKQLRGVADAERQNLAQATRLSPPGRLRDEHLHALEALGLRVSGVTGLADTFQKTAASTDNTADAELLVQQANRLVASDVVWEDLFRALALEQLADDGISGVNVPESKFVSNPDLVTVESMTLVVERIRGASTGGTSTGPRGTLVVSVRALPVGQSLTKDVLTTVTATADLTLQVTIEDSGDSQEVGIDVTLTIDRSTAQGGPIVQTQEVDVINPGEQKSVTFTDLGQVPFATQTEVRVDVETVENETNPDNNTATYPVIFSLP